MSVNQDAVPLDDADIPRWRFWGTLVWGIVLAVIFIAVQTVVVIFMAVRRQGRGASLDHILTQAADGSTIAYSTLMTAVVCIPLIAGVVKLRRGARLRQYLGLRAPPAGSMRRWLIVVAVFAAASDLVMLAFGRPVVPPFMEEAYATAVPVWPLWLALVVAAPALEETFFRGFVLAGFRSTVLGPAGAVIVTALMWALVHLQYGALEIAIIACAGLLLGAARLATGSLYVPLAMHAMINLVSTVEVALFR